MTLLYIQGVTIHNTMDLTVPCVALMLTMIRAIFRRDDVRNVSLAIKETNVNNVSIVIYSYLLQKKLGYSNVLETSGFTLLYP